MSNQSINQSNVSGRWRYTCQDVYALVRAWQPGKTVYQLDRVGVQRDSGSQYDTFVDHVVLNRQDTVSDVGECRPYVTAHGA